MPLARMAFSSAVSADLPTRTSCRAGFGHVTCYVSGLAPLTLARGIASSMKPRAQRRCTSHEQGNCTKAPSSANPWRMLHITPPPLPLRASLVNDPPLPLPGIACRATATIVSAITSSLCCWSAIPSASSDCYGHSARRET